MLRLAAGGACPSLVPVLVDQTAVGEVQVLTASYPVEGRAIPLAMATFQHAKLDVSQSVFSAAWPARLPRKPASFGSWTGAMAEPRFCGFAARSIGFF
jgi:hypothetical protein